MLCNQVTAAAMSFGIIKLRQKPTISYSKMLTQFNSRFGTNKKRELDETEKNAELEQLGYYETDKNQLYPEKDNEYYKEVNLEGPIAQQKKHTLIELSKVIVSNPEKLDSFLEIMRSQNQEMNSDPDCLSLELIRSHSESPPSFVLTKIFKNKYA